MARIAARPAAMRVGAAGGRVGMFEVREEEDGLHFSVVSGGERIAVTRSRESADALVDALEDGWAAAFGGAVAQVRQHYPYDLLDPTPGPAEG
ncbi:hypothetical protein M0638_02105 [Roseomonas sp. NAR14]|uniref:Uncharacterized protein n=1 Tax=Roseomonas acroporae TaxID=2937791 RepID=A0A9X1Y418_9PROT|nr:hypothetical protein [Roseomonas acroporae]MCK8783171.1 hypothetical protein [Roseomonas acroporae]